MNWDQCSQIKLRKTIYHLQTIIFLPPNTALVTMHSDRRHSPGRRQSQAYHPNGKESTLIHHSRKFVSTAIWSNAGLLCTILIEQRAWIYDQRLMDDSTIMKTNQMNLLMDGIHQNNTTGFETFDICVTFGWMRFFQISLDSIRRFLFLNFADFFAYSDNHCSSSSFESHRCGVSVG